MKVFLLDTSLSIVKALLVVSFFFASSAHSQESVKTHTETEADSKGNQQHHTVELIAKTERIGKINAALIYYIAKFIDFKKPATEPIDVCIIGVESMKSYIDETFAGKQAHGNSLRVSLKRNNLSEAELNGCEIAFWGLDTSKEDLAMVRHASAMGILNICMVPKLNWGTCLVQIFEENNKPRIGIDLKDRSASNFIVSSELLEVSEVNKKDSND